MMKQYKALFIDWDDTIGDFVGAAQQALRKVYELYQLEKYFQSYDEFYQTYHQHNLELWEKYGKDQVTKQYLSLDRFLYPLMNASKTPDHLSTDDIQHLFQMATQIAENFLQWTTDYFTLLPGAEQAIVRLAERYPLIILSNGFIEVQYHKIQRSGLSSYFQHVVLSEEVGCQKPNPRIYQAALDRCGLKSEDVLMIGDSWYSDILGAINAGIDQMWIKRGEHTPDDQQKVTFLVRDLAEAADLLLKED